MDSTQFGSCSASAAICRILHKLGDKKISQKVTRFTSRYNQHLNIFNELFAKEIDKGFLVYNLINFYKDQIRILEEYHFVSDLESYLKCYMAGRYRPLFDQFKSIS